MSTAAIRVSRLTATATTTANIHRTFATVSIKPKPSHHRDHVQNHVYQKPTPSIGSFLRDEPPRTPKEAYAKLAKLRREYAKQVKDVRKNYIHEVELQKQELLRKVEARKAELLRQKEERLKIKAAASKARALERKASEDDFRSQLMKERAEKLEYWRSRQKAIAGRKNNEKELICKQSSRWIDEKELEAKVMQAMVDSGAL